MNVRTMFSRQALGHRAWLLEDPFCLDFGMRGIYSIVPLSGSMSFHSGRKRGPCCQAIALSSVRLWRAFLRYTIASSVALFGKIVQELNPDKTTPKQIPQMRVSVSAREPKMQKIWNQIKSDNILWLPGTTKPDSTDWCCFRRCMKACLTEKARWYYCELRCFWA